MKRLCAMGLVTVALCAQDSSGHRVQFSADCQVARTGFSIWRWCRYDGELQQEVREIDGLAVQPQQTRVER